MLFWPYAWSDLSGKTGDAFNLQMFGWSHGKLQEDVEGMLVVCISLSVLAN
jgi:hypothetical protein